MKNERTVEEKIILAAEKGLMRIMLGMWLCLFFYLTDGIIPVFATLRIFFENHLIRGMIFYSLLFLLFWILVLCPLISIRLQIEESRKENKRDTGTEMG